MSREMPEKNLAMRKKTLELEHTSKEPEMQWRLGSTI
jgi:hypothetical protein